jgi:hypothetical protein
MITSHRVPVDIFQDVHKTFLETLSEQEKLCFQSFPDAKSMLNAVENIVIKSPVHRSKLAACVIHVNALANRLSSYFEIFAIFVPSQPEIPGLAWGAIRLVFQVSPLHLGATRCSPSKSRCGY